MRRTKRFSRAALIALVVGAAALVAIGAYAFTASNTVPDTNAGAGTADVSGYTVSDVHYTLNATTPTDVDSLSFTVSPAIPAAGRGTVVVSVGLTSGGPNSYDCTRNAAGDTVTCATTSPQLTAESVTDLTVVAAQ